MFCIDASGIGLDVALVFDCLILRKIDFMMISYISWTYHGCLMLLNEFCLIALAILCWYPAKDTLQKMCLDALLLEAFCIAGTDRKGS